MKIHLITQHEHSDSIENGGDFNPEAYLLEESAKSRLLQLREESKDSGYYFVLQEIEVKN